MRIYSWRNAVSGSTLISYAREPGRFSVPREHDKDRKIEGRFNEALLLTMEDEREAIVKLPCPNVGPPYCTTASGLAILKLRICPTLIYIILRSDCVIASSITDLIQSCQGLNGNRSCKPGGS